MNKLINLELYIYKYQVMKNVMLRHSSQIVTVENGYDNFYNLKTTDPHMLSYNKLEGEPTK